MKSIIMMPIAIISVFKFTSHDLLSSNYELSICHQLELCSLQAPSPSQVEQWFSIRYWRSSHLRFLQSMLAISGNCLFHLLQPGPKSQPYTLSKLWGCKFPNIFLGVSTMHTVKSPFLFHFCKLSQRVFFYSGAQLRYLYGSIVCQTKVYHLVLSFSHHFPTQIANSSHRRAEQTACQFYSIFSSF